MKNIFIDHANLIIRVGLMVIAVTALSTVVVILYPGAALTPREDATVSICSGIALSSLSYFLSDWLVKKLRDGELSDLIQTQVSKAVRHGKVHTVETTPWAELINGATKIDFVVQGWNSWFNKVEVTAPLQAFFQKKGKLNLYVYHYDEAASINSLFDTWKMRVDGKNVAHEMGGSISGAFHRLENSPGSKSDQLKVRLLKTVNWYCAIRFTPGPLLISPYAHFHRGTASAPVFLFNLEENAAFKQWWKDELKFLEDSEKSEALDREKFESWKKPKKP